MKIAQQSLATMEKAIALSHERSKSYNIDPFFKKASEDTKLSKSALQKNIKEQENLFEITKEQIDSLCTLLKGAGFYIAFTDKKGYVLYVNGDTSLHQHFKSRNYTPGYRWREQDVGTCAIGLVLIEKKPFFVPGSQMFATGAKTISNAAAPIFDDNQELLGVICISGYSERMHIHTLGLACQAAETVGVKLKRHHNLREIDINNKYMRALLEAGTRGIIAIDQEGRIAQTNKLACTLLSLPHEHTGSFLTEYITTEPPFIFDVHKGKGFLMREVKNTKGAYFVSLAPVILENGENVGAILSIIQKKEIVQLAMELTGSEANFTFSSIIGKSKNLHSALHVAKIAAKNDAPILILGETGTGKELFAQAIHNASSRSNKPFLTINCGAIPKELLESELFGYEDGAFTGALKGGKVGKFELADTGTIFLDEIGDMPFDMQVKLLRVLQSGEIQRVGSAKTTKINLRVISATNKDLITESDAGNFRPDLFYRISTLMLTVPSLRERKSDIPLFIETFMKRHGIQNTESMLSPQVKKHLINYSWPGNVRQLENAVERAVYLAQGEPLKLEHFGIFTTEKTTGKGNYNMQVTTLENIEKDAIIQTLKHFEGNLSQCASSLGISRPTLYRKLEKYAINPEIPIS